MAQDKGYPPLSRTVEVQIDVVDRANNPPVWDHVVYGPIYVKENMPVGGKVVSVKARSVVKKNTSARELNVYTLKCILYTNLYENKYIHTSVLPFNRSFARKTYNSFFSLPFNTRQTQSPTSSFNRIIHLFEFSVDFKINVMLIVATLINM